MFSEREDIVRATATPVTVPRSEIQIKSPSPPEVKPPVKKETIDVQKFYEDLIEKSEKSSRLELEDKWPEALPATTNSKRKEDESNLSDLYNRIMSEHQYDFAKKKEKPAKVDISVVSEFNPPLGQCAIANQSYLKDQTFQQSSCISELRRVLDEEEGLDNVSQCSFQSDYKKQD